MLRWVVFVTIPLCKALQAVFAGELFQGFAILAPGELLTMSGLHPASLLQYAYSVWSAPPQTWGQPVCFLFAVTFYAFEVEFPAATVLISVLEITFSRSLVLQSFRKGNGKQQLSKLSQPLLIIFPLSVLSHLTAHAVKCPRWKAP